MPYPYGTLGSNSDVWACFRKPRRDLDDLDISNIIGFFHFPPGNGVELCALNGRVVVGHGRSISMLLGGSPEISRRIKQGKIVAWQEPAIYRPVPDDLQRILDTQLQAAE